MPVAIKRSRRLLQIKVGTVAFVALFLIILSFFMLNMMGGFLKTNIGIKPDLVILSWAMRLFILLVAGLAIFSTWQRGRYKQYLLDDNKLIISKGHFSKSQQIITLEPRSVSSLDLSQTFFGKLIGYGTIQIVIDTYGGKETYRLDNIEQPEEIFKEINRYIKIQQGGS